MIPGCVLLVFSYPLRAEAAGGGGTGKRGLKRKTKEGRHERGKCSEPNAKE